MIAGSVISTVSPSFLSTSLYGGRAGPEWVTQLSPLTDLHMLSRQLIIPQPHPPTHSLHVMVSDFCESGCSYKCFLKRPRQRAYVDTSSLFSCASPLTVRVCTWVNSLRFCTLLLVGWVKHFSALNDPRQWRDGCKRARTRTHMFSSIQAHTHVMPIPHRHILMSLSHTHIHTLMLTHTYTMI